MRQKHKASVVFEPAVVEYLESLQEKFDRDRSWLINAIVRDYARRATDGQNLDLFDPSIALLKLDAEQGEYWDNAGVQGLKYAFEAIKAYAKGETPAADDRQHAKVDL